MELRATAVGSGNVSLKHDASKREAVSNPGSNLERLHLTRHNFKRCL